MTKNRKKSVDVARLLTPVFGDGSDVIELDFDSIKNGGCLYGDIAKREGLKSALAWSEKNKKNIRVVELAITLKGKSLQGVNRLDEDDLSSGEFGMVRLEKYAVKIDLYSAIADLICDAALKKHINLHGGKNLSMHDWMLIDPSVARIVFDRYPSIDLIAVNSKPFYSEAPVMTVIIKDRDSVQSMSVMYDSEAKVVLV